VTLTEVDVLSGTKPASVAIPTVYKGTCEKKVMKVEANDCTIDFTYTETLSNAGALHKTGSRTP
jgi:hypothetical protein